MNATSRAGVWQQQITEKTTLIVDTNKNQIIKRTNGVPTVHQYPSTPTIAMVQTYIELIKLGEFVDGLFQEAKNRIALRKTEKKDACFNRNPQTSLTECRQENY